jgi:hypothetical protein
MPEHVTTDLSSLDLFLGPGAPMRVTFVGNFLTDLTLDSEMLRLSGYERAQALVAATLNGPDRHEWAYLQPSRGTHGLRFAVGGRSHEAALPLSFIRRTGYELDTRVTDHRLDSESASWHLAGLSLSFFDFGIGSLVADYVLTANEGLSASELRLLVEGVSMSLVEPYNILIKESLEELRAAVASQLHDSAVNPAWFGESEHQVVLPGAVGELLWLHRLYIVDNADESFDEYVRLSPKLLPTFYESHVATDFCYQPGLSSSAVVLRRPASGGTGIAWLIDTVAFQFAYVALFMEIDRALLAQFTDLTVTSRRAGQRKLTDNSSSISRVYERVRWVRALLNTVIATGGAAAAKVWEQTAQVQNFPLLEKSVDDKLDALQAMYNHRMQELSAARARIVSLYVATFTLFAVASSIFAVIDFVLGGSLLRLDTERLLIATSVVSACLVAILLALRHGALRSGGSL